MAAALGADLIFFQELTHLSIGGIALHNEALAVHQGGSHHAVFRFGPVLRHDAQQRLAEQLGEVELFTAGGGKERDIHLTGSQPFLHIVVGALIHLDFDLRVVGHKAFEQARQQRSTHRVEYAQLHLALFQAVQAGNALLEGLVAVEHIANRGVQGCAVAGHGYAVLAAVEQSKAQLLLHYGNGVTDGRWGQVQLLCRLVEAALPGHGIKDLVGKKRHAQSLLPSLLVRRRPILCESFSSFI